MTDPRDPQEPVQEDEVSPGSLPEGATVGASADGEAVTALEAASETDGMAAEGVEDVGALAGADEEADTVPSAPAAPVATAAAASTGGASAPASAAKPAGSATGASASDAAELPYVDDPVSKWWVGIIVATFVILFAWAIFFSDALDGFFEAAEPTAPAIPSPVAGASPTVSAAPLPTPQVSSGASPAPVTEPPASPAPASASPATQATTVPPVSAGSTDVPDAPASPAG